jgi:hypothetical protein
MERVGLEAGATSPWLCHALLALKWPAICIETRHAKAAMAAQNVKTDRNDARGIAHIMRTGWFRAVHVKSHESQKLRVLLGNRKPIWGSDLQLLLLPTGRSGRFNPEDLPTSTLHQMAILALCLG